MKKLLYFLGVVAVLLNPANSFALADDVATGDDADGPYFYQLPEMVVNLRSDGRSLKILKIKLNLEVDSMRDFNFLEKIQPRVISEFQTYLRHLYADDFNGTNIDLLKSELLSRANYVAKPIKFRDVLFRSLLVQ
jgi:flagellar FliL protein